MLKIHSNMTTAQIKLALETSLIKGFCTENATFPIASVCGDTPTAENADNLAKLFSTALAKHSASGDKPLDYVADSLYSLDFRCKKGLENLFADGVFLKDTDSDFLPDKLDVKFVLPQNPDISTVIAACNFAFRFGMETTALSTDILAGENYKGNSVIFKNSGKASMYMEEKDGFHHLYVCGCGRELEEISALVCEKFPVTGIFDRWSDVLSEMARDFAMQTADGQLAYLESLKETQPNLENTMVYATPDLEEWQKRHYDNVLFANHKSGLRAYSKSYDIPWEADVLRSIMAEKVYPFINKNDIVSVTAAVSENAEIRGILAEEMQNNITAKGGVADNITIINAYKQGFCWIEEFIIPQLKKAEKQTDKIEIYFKPFLPEGQSEWIDENGATPNRTRGLENTPDKWFDLPVRYLQELYPIDDVLSAQLGIPRDNIEFKAYEGNEDITYLFKAFSDGEESFCSQYKSRCSSRPYMDQYPQLGIVHPSTGYVKVFVNGKPFFETEIKTDLENVWDIYQSQILPDCRRYIESKHGTSLTAQNQPFFKELHLDIQLSEEERRLPCREDIISPLSALHEDLYFTGGDYFKYYGQSTGQKFDAPGLILPDLHIGEGKPVVNVTLYEQLSDKAKIARNGHTIYTEKSTDDINVFISKLGMENGQLVVTISAEGVEEKVLKSYSKLWDKAVLNKSRTVQNVGKIIFTNGTEYYFANCNAEPAYEKTLDINDIDICEDEVIGYEKYLEIINQLKLVKGIEVFPIAESYLGRKIYAVWFKKEHECYLSMTKLLTGKISQFINSRHHANEVSSTNSAFMLIKKLLCDPCYEQLTDKLNLVIVPMENTDGTAIHYKLQKEHPLWQLHTARFNALGKEFAYEYFDAKPLSREALATGRIYQKFVPDIMVDNHGVPSHEWDQQFSGYTSPAYKGFWLPRSLLYGYFWYVNNPEYSANIALNKAMEAEIAKEIAENAQMTDLNKDWADRFEKYAHKWMPLLFPAEYFGDMINYWIAFPMNHSHMYTAVRYPWLTAVAYTSEVADETAQGDYLNLCAKAHLAHDEATIKMLMGAETAFEKEISVTDNGISAKFKRLRPVKVK